MSLVDADLQRAVRSWEAWIWTPAARGIHVVDLLFV